MAEGWLGEGGHHQVNVEGCVIDLVSSPVRESERVDADSDTTREILLLHLLLVPGTTDVAHI